MSDTWWIDPDQLDEDQKAVLNDSLDGNTLVVGPPGSGKTNLLILQANKLNLSGITNFVVLTFTRSLRDFLSAGAGKYRFDATKVKTSTQWARETLRGYGYTPPNDDNFQVMREQLFSAMSVMIRQERLGQLYDAILLDEAHDYLPAEIELFASITPRLFAVADLRQKIYKGADVIGKLKQIANRTHTLRFHYRNGLWICNLADNIQKDRLEHERMVERTQYREKDRPSTAELIKCASMEDAIQKVIEAVALQLRAYPEEVIGILCARREEAEAVGSKVISALGGIAGTYMSESEVFAAGKNVIISTIHLSKGLEFRAVHVLGVDAVMKFPLQRNMMFTAVTRGKTSVQVYYVEKLPSFLEGAFSALKPVTAPSLAALFGETKDSE